jgi:hypothetical protein
MVKIHSTNCNRFAKYDKFILKEKHAFIRYPSVNVYVHVKLAFANPEMLLRNLLLTMLDQLAIYSPLPPQHDDGSIFRNTKEIGKLRCMSQTDNE